MREIANAVATRAPDAWFLNFTNPAGLVTEALRDVLGDRAIGICDSPISLGRAVACGAGTSRRGARVRLRGAEPSRLAARGPRGRPGPPPRAPGRRAGHRRGGGPPVRPRRDPRAGHDPQRVPRVLRASPTPSCGRMRERGATRGQLVEQQQAGFFDERYDGPADALAGWRRARDARHAGYMDEAGGDRGEPRDLRGRAAGRRLRCRRGRVPASGRDRRVRAADPEHRERRAHAVPRRRRRRGSAEPGGTQRTLAGPGRRAAPRPAGSARAREGCRAPHAPRLERTLRRPRASRRWPGIRSSDRVRSPNGSSRATWSVSPGSRTCSTEDGSFGRHGRHTSPGRLPSW